MRFSIIISNYNFSCYVVDSIQSVLKQSYENFEVIVVDDGSTDNSIEAIKKIQDERIILIEKKNAGQLSCFNVALELITGDIVCLLDADDLYPENYLEYLKKKYSSLKDCDFAFCSVQLFGKEERLDKFAEKIINFGYTSSLAYFLNSWIGGPASSISMRVEIYRLIFPLNELEPDWKIRADDVIVWGASLLGAVKYYFHDICVKYRVHDNNNYSGSKLSDYQLQRRNLAIQRFKNYFVHYKSQINYIETFNYEFESNLFPTKYFYACFTNNKRKFILYPRIILKIFIRYFLCKRKAVLEDERLNKLVL